MGQTVYIKLSSTFSNRIDVDILVWCWRYYSYDIVCLCALSSLHFSFFSTLFLAKYTTYYDGMMVWVVNYAKAYFCSSHALFKYISILNLFIMSCIASFFFSGCVVLHTGIYCLSGVWLHISICEPILLGLCCHLHLEMFFQESYDNIALTTILFLWQNLVRSKDSSFINMAAGANEEVQIFSQYVSNMQY